MKASDTVRNAAAGFVLVPIGALALLIALVLLLSLGTAMLVGGIGPVRRGVDAVIRDT